MHSTMFGTMDSGTKFTSLICPPSFVGGSSIFLLEESYRSKLKVSCLQKFTPGEWVVRWGGVGGVGWGVVVREHTRSCGDQLSCEGGSGSGRSSAADWG